MPDISPAWWILPSHRRRHLPSSLARAYLESRGWSVDGRWASRPGEDSTPFSEALQRQAHDDVATQLCALGHRGIDPQDHTLILHEAKREGMFGNRVRYTRAARKPKPPTDLLTLYFTQSKTIPLRGVHRREAEFWLIQRDWLPTTRSRVEWRNRDYRGPVETIRSALYFAASFDLAAKLRGLGYTCPHAPRTPAYGACCVSPEGVPMTIEQATARAGLLK
jgi:hypothetical protein